MKKTIFILTAAIIILAAGIGAYFVLQDFDLEQNNQENKNQESNLITGQTDEYVPENMALNLEQEIEKLFIEKYNLEDGGYKINISQNTESHARGGITFLDESGQPAEGGLFLAAKTESGWQLVFDGNGAIACSLLREYGFPDEMMSDCHED